MPLPFHSINHHDYFAGYVREEKKNAVDSRGAHTSTTVTDLYGETVHQRSPSASDVIVLHRPPTGRQDPRRVVHLAVTGRSVSGRPLDLPSTAMWGIPWKCRPGERRGP